MIELDVLTQVKNYILNNYPAIAEDLFQQYALDDLVSLSSPTISKVLLAPYLGEDLGNFCIYIWSDKSNFEIKSMSKMISTNSEISITIVLDQDQKYTYYITQLVAASLIKTLIKDVQEGSNMNVSLDNLDWFEGIDTTKGLVNTLNGFRLNITIKYS